MNKEEYTRWSLFFIYLTGVAVGIAFCLIAIIVIPYVNAEDNITINNTYVINNSYYYNQTFNYTINNTYWLNVTTNISYYNITNITYCYNCSYNITNITYVNWTITNVTNYYNGSNFTAGNYYNRAEIDSKHNTLDEKFNSYLLKADYKEPTNSTIKDEWRTTDNFMAIGIAIAIVLALMAIVLIMRNE